MSNRTIFVRGSATALLKALDAIAESRAKGVAHPALRASDGSRGARRPNGLAGHLRRMTPHRVHLGDGAPY